MALGQIQVVVGVDVGKAAIIAGETKRLRVVGAEGAVSGSMASTTRAWGPLSR